MMQSHMISIVSNTIFLSLIVGVPAYGLMRKVRVYDVFVEGAKEGFEITIKILPNLVAILVAIGMLRASGALTNLTDWLAPMLKHIGMPAEVLPMALMRPFSGSAANGMLADLVHTYGGNSFIAMVAATLMGSTETTFYVIAVYFGAVGIRKTRYAIPVGLLADLTGIIAAVWICRLVFLS